MTFDEFSKSLTVEDPPIHLSGYLLSLWYDAKGDWKRAHEIVQDTDDNNGAWIHAYLHRKEGDIGNADYWYSRSGHKRPGESLEQEWMQIVKALLQ
ncbi:MAG TPA: hypothetical protein VGI82_08260 [Chitinophagaceae bacterium]|jgi:hypothetical protein